MIEERYLLTLRDQNTKHPVMCKLAGTTIHDHTHNANSPPLCGCDRVPKPPPPQPPGSAWRTPPPGFWPGKNPRALSTWSKTPICMHAKPLKPSLSTPQSSLCSRGLLQTPGSPGHAFVETRPGLSPTNSTRAMTLALEHGVRRARNHGSSDSQTYTLQPPNVGHTFETCNFTDFESQRLRMLVPPSFVCELGAPRLHHRSLQSESPTTWHLGGRPTPEASDQKAAQPFGSHFRLRAPSPSPTPPSAASSRGA